MPRQEYIARVRYQNPLPPPPGAPKLVDYGLDISSLLSADSLSEMVYARNLNLEPDAELGMPIDLSMDVDAFNTGAPLAGAETEASLAELSPADLELLGDPVPYKPGATTGTPAVSSSSTSRVPSVVPEEVKLERAEAIADAAASTAFLKKKARSAGIAGAARTKRSTKSTQSTDRSREVAEAELARIESTFDLASVSLDTLRHPKKPGVHAVRALPVLPEFQQFDLEHTIVRMVGSASLSHLAKPVSTTRLRSAVFAQLGDDIDELEQEKAWIGVYVPESDEESIKLRERLDDQRDTLPPTEVEREANEVWDLPRLQDNDAETVRHRQKFEELVLSSDGSSVYYTPIVSRTNLRRRRVDAKQRAAQRQEEVSILEVQLREVTADESISRDEQRSHFDPVSYGV